MDMRTSAEFRAHEGSADQPDCAEDHTACGLVLAFDASQPRVAHDPEDIRAGAAPGGWWNRSRRRKLL